MPAAFGAWHWFGGHRYPFSRLSPFDNESEVREYARKYKKGQRVGRHELSEKFRALEIDNWDRWIRGIRYCDYCKWEMMWMAKESDEDREKLDEHDEYMYYQECKGFCRDRLSDELPFNHTKGVYALNREAFSIHDAHRRKGRASASHSRRHRTSGQKRSALKKDARNALRDFDSGD